MSRPPLLLGLMLLAATASAGDPAPLWIEGRVVDAEGRPVTGVEVSPHWSANGWKLDAKGEVIGSVATPKDVARFWSHVGQMEPTANPVRTGPDGSFRVQVRGTRTHHVLAMDADRSRGALGILPVGREAEPITLRLGPLVRVKGDIRGPSPGETPAWTHVYVERAQEPERPVDFYRLAGCGSFDARFDLLLPPGRYRFDAYNDPDAPASRGRVEPAPELTILGTEGTIDLGTWQLTPQAEPPFARTRKLQAEHKLPSLKDWAGRMPPPVFADDARGILKDWQPGRSGKWQLVVFWGRDCPVCITRTMPDLMAFQAEHAGQADRFEIISVFIDVDGKTNTIAAMDEALRPIVQHVWKGKSPPFPTLVDASTRTVESFGLSGYGAMILINPEGKVVPGDIETLRGILDRK